MAIFSPGACPRRNFPVHEVVSALPALAVPAGNAACLTCRHHAMRHRDTPVPSPGGHAQSGGTGLSTPGNENGETPEAGIDQGPKPAKAVDGVHASYRPVLQTVARLIASDRRAVLLANEAGEVLLANAPAKRLGLDRDLRKHLDWPDLCTVVKRAGSASVSVSIEGVALEGELVLLPLGPASGYYLRLSETDDEALWLRNRARAATLLRVTHDLRTPIQSLLASAEILLQQQDRGDDALDRLRRVADLSLDHISNVLAVIRGEQSAAAARRDEVFSLKDELGQLIDIIHPIADRRNVSMTLSLPEDSDTRVIGPVRFVRALFQNMIDNAVKHGGAAVEVALTVAPLRAGIDDLRAKESRLEITLEVRDQGGGLPENQKDRLRQALGQGGSVTSPAPQEAQKRPSGGMNVLAHALTQLGGHLSLLDRGADGERAASEGEEVVGTILRAVFSLPAAETSETAAIETMPQDTDGLLRGKTLLVVEDSPASQAWLSHVLQAAGAEVQVAGSGKAALSVLENPTGRGIDLVLSDVTLPQMSGVELARRIASGIASGSINPAPRVLGLTAHIDERIRDACLQAGMQRVLEKPIRPGPLCHAAREALDAPKLPVPMPPTSPPPAKVSKKTNAAKSPRQEGTVLNDSVVTELVSGLGPEGARKFMSRALGEASTALVSLKTNGVTDRIDCTMHAATGACGLTGLALLDTRMRVLEDAVKSGKTDLSEEIATVTDALTRTAKAIKALGTEPQIS